MKKERSLDWREEDRGWGNGKWKMYDGRCDEREITTEPDGYESDPIVQCTPADTSEAGVHTVTATCGTSEETCDVTVVEVASVSCNGVTSTTDEPGEDETVYVLVGNEGDTVEITAQGNLSRGRHDFKQESIPV